MQDIVVWFGLAIAALALCGAVYAVASALLAWRFMRRPAAASKALSPVTILKPLHLAHPGLFEHLETFFRQDYTAPVQIVFGVHDRADPALGVVSALQAKYPNVETQIVIDGRLYGANRKISNLINMSSAARHDVLVMADADISAPANWLREVTGALEARGVGLVTCLYTGTTHDDRARGRVWSMLSAMGTSYEFLPNVIFGLSFGLATPCFGSTVALTRKVLGEIGGFNAFSNFLADDYEMGRAVREKGYRVAIPPISVGHASTEHQARELFRHELRWTRTIRMVNPAGHGGSIVTLTLPLALIAAICLGFSPLGLGVLGTALVARLFLKWRIDRIFGTYAGPAWLVPARDLLTFAVFLTSLFGETVHWRGTRFEVEPTGAMSQL